MFERLQIALAPQVRAISLAFGIVIDGYLFQRAFRNHVMLAHNFKLA